ECQICNAPLDALSETARQAHYEQHFEDDPMAGPVVSSGRLSTYFQRKAPPQDANWDPPANQNVFWHAAREDAVDPPPNFTPGLISLLKRALAKTHAKGTTQRAWLCADGACHVATERWDMGWGCGYRNFLMACAALMAQDQRPEYAHLLQSPLPPGVRNLQKWIQQAWQDGYDEEGAEQLKNRLIGTRRWIGTGELYTAFTHRGIPCVFTVIEHGQRAHPQRYSDTSHVAGWVAQLASPAEPQTVLRWVREYFDPPSEHSSIGNAVDVLKGASAVTVTKKMPLVLQHAGHSRTIVGIVVNRVGDMNLLIFDPSSRPPRQVRDAALAAHLKIEVDHTHPHLSKLKRVLHPLDKTNKRGAPSGPPEAKKVKLSDGTMASVPQTHTRAASLAIAETQIEPLKLIKLFRLNGTKLGKNSKYQILFFPMDKPYDDAGRWAHREVTSQQVRG
ncbi:DUF1671-domain-containing protein, partial [Auricularia subglabra TFB-10046 SS5]